MVCVRAVYFVGMLLMLAFLGACDGVEAEDLVQKEVQVVSQVEVETIPPAVREAYQEDSGQLVFRLFRERDADEINLPSDQIASVYDALLRVYKADSLSAHDAIVGIHTFPVYSATELSMTVDTTIAWTQALREGRPVSGQSVIDALVERYKLATTYTVSQFRHFVFLQAAEPINTLALSSRLESVGGVVYADPEGRVGDGNDIEARILSNGWELVYSVGSGDCPSGCISRQYWTYRVINDGTVIYLGERTNR